MIKGTVLLDNKRLFLFYGMLNIVLLAFLLTLLILLFNEIFVLSRTVYVIFIAVHISLIFFVRIHYLRIVWDEDSQLIDISYNKKFGLRWNHNAIRVALPLNQFDGYSIGKDNFGLAAVTVFKLEKKQRYELGPFHIGYISAQSKKSLEDAFGESLS